MHFTKWYLLQTRLLFELMGYFFNEEKICLTAGIAGCRPEDGVPDMTVISDIDEVGINKNLRVRYTRDQVYVSGMASIGPPPKQNIIRSSV